MIGPGSDKKSLLSASGSGNLTRSLVTPNLYYTRSSWLNCALRDDEAVYWVRIRHYEAVAIGT